jgi:hypothetical protein
MEVNMKEQELKAWSAPVIEDLGSLTELTEGAVNYSDVKYQ